MFVSLLYIEQAGRKVHPEGTRKKRVSANIKHKKTQQILKNDFTWPMNVSLPQQFLWILLHVFDLMMFPIKVKEKFLEKDTGPNFFFTIQSQSERPTGAEEENTTRNNILGQCCGGNKSYIYTYNLGQWFTVWGLTPRGGILSINKKSILYNLGLYFSKLSSYASSMATVMLVCWPLLWLKCLNNWMDWDEIFEILCRHSWSPVNGRCMCFE